MSKEIKNNDIVSTTTSYDTEVANTKISCVLK